MDNLSPVAGCSGCAGTAGRLGCSKHSADIYVSDQSKKGKKMTEYNFRFKHGDKVKHKLGCELVVIQRQIRFAIKDGEPSLWYLCRVENMADFTIAEIELE